MIRTHSLLVSLALLLACLAGCASIGDSGFSTREPGTPMPPRMNPNGGHLVIVGGGLKKNNTAIRERFISLCAEGPIGIIPIASGDGLSAGETSAEGWRELAGTRKVIVIALTKDSTNANDADLARQIADCGGIWFTGGDQSRVTAVLKPKGEQTECLKACFSVLARGGVIGGTSAGAALMTDPMITGGQSPGRRTRDPEETTASSVRIGPGIGFLSCGLTDQHFLERGRMGRLISALHERGIHVGFGIRENCALVVDRERGVGEAMGDRAVCVLAPVFRPMDETSANTRCASLSVLSTGDTVAFGRGEFDPRSITPARGLVRPGNGPRPASSRAAATRRVADPWDMAVIENALDRLENDPAQLTLQSDRLALELGGMSSARVFTDPTGARHACIVNITVSVRPAPPSPAAAPEQE